MPQSRSNLPKQKGPVRQVDVLVTEDDADIREVVVQILEGEGYRVADARNGADALEQLKNGLRPRMILFDLMMPVMSGWQFRKELVKLEEFNSTPLVVITADSGAAKDPGPLQVNALLAKPVQLSDLLECIARFIGEGDPELDSLEFDSSDSESTDSDSTDSESKDSDPTVSDSTDSDPTDSAPTDSDPTDSDPTDSDSTDSESPAPSVGGSKR